MSLGSSSTAYSSSLSCLLHPWLCAGTARDVVKKSFEILCIPTRRNVQLLCQAFENVITYLPFVTDHWPVRLGFTLLNQTVQQISFAALWCFVGQPKRKPPSIF